MKRKYEAPSVTSLDSSLEQAAGLTCSPSGFKAVPGTCQPSGFKAEGSACESGFKATDGFCVAGFRANAGCNAGDKPW